MKIRSAKGSEGFSTGSAAKGRRASLGISAHTSRRTRAVAAF